MSLTAGDKLGPYEIIALIGKGGMGEVYSAHDPRTGRDVAIKVSKEQFNERFDREVRAVASLNHPNICTLFDVGPNYLVMELVEGESPRGPLPLDIAMNYARQIAAALEEAHERGVVHRDLKPGNIKIKPDGTVKVLDFGLAKMGGTPAAQSEDSPTISMAATQAGVILGTAAYMAPEQAKGKPVDKRADIWAFGVVLYEMLTGERLFQHEDLTETLAAVVMKSPDLEQAPVKVRRLLKKCLEKDPKKRLRDIGDAWELLEEPPAPLAAAGLRTARVGWMAWIATVAVLVAAVGIALWAPWRKAAMVEPVRFEIFAPPKTTFTNWMTVSPDARKIAFTALGADGQVRLWVRSLDTLEAKSLTPTAGNPTPFWSPDSRTIAYQYQGKLRKVEVSGGPSQALCDASAQFDGGAWNQDGVIVFAGTDGLMRVSSAGGVPQKLTSLDPSRQEIAHAGPVFLPDGRHFLYHRRSSTPENSGIYIGSLDDAPGKPASQPLLVSALNALYAPAANGSPGYVLFARDNSLMAQPFDAAKLELAGEAVPVADPVGRMASRFVNASLSANGALLYRSSGLAELRQLTWFETGGKAPAPISTPGLYAEVALSPDGTRAAVSQSDSQQNNFDLWTLDLAKALKTRFTFDPAEDRYPVWSPDGSRIVFSSVREGARNLYSKPSNGATNEEALLKSNEEKIALDWSHDGKYLLYGVNDPKTKADLWYLPMKESERKPARYLATEFNEGQARFSPDERFVAYASDESGSTEIYVRTFPDPSGKWQVSKNNGAQPRWRGDGKELFYLAGGTRIMAVDVTTGATFQSGEPKVLVDARVPSGYDATADGKRFLIATGSGDSAADPITVVLNWQAGLKK